ncbi:MAG: hypothetical protein ABI539_13350 [Acidobacteriota bacterium]
MQEIIVFLASQDVNDCLGHRDKLRFFLFRDITKLIEKGSFKLIGGCSREMKTLFLILALAFSGFAQTKVVSKYDKFKDTTFVNTESESVKPSKSSRIVSIFGLSMSGAFSYPGATLEKNVDTFVLFFRSSSRSWQYLTSNNLIILADGKSIDLGKAHHKGDVSSSRYSTGVTELMSYVIDRETLETIGKATKVEMQLGGFEGEFKTDDIALINALLKAGTK